MRKRLIVLWLLTLPASARAQELPRLTREGAQAALKLLEECHEAGALKVVTDSRMGGKQGVVADEAKLKQVVKQWRKVFTPALRNALIQVGDSPGTNALLLALGQETGDAQALAFGKVFSARLLQQQRKEDAAEQAYEEAARHFERLKLQHWQATTLYNLAESYREQGNLTRARKRYQQALDLFKGLFGERHRQVAHCLTGLALVWRAEGNLVQARKLHQQALDLLEQLHPPPHLDIAKALNNLGENCRAQGDLPQARKFHERALALKKRYLGEGHSSVAFSLFNLAAVCQDQGDLAEARRLSEQALELFRRHYGARHPLVAKALNGLAEVCRAQGDLTQSHKLNQQALDLRQQILPVGHPDIAISLNNLAMVCQAQGDLPRARKLYRQALDCLKQHYGERHPTVALVLGNLASVYKEQGDLPRAETLFQQTLALDRELHGERHPSVALSLNNLAMIASERGQLARSRKLQEQALALFKQIHGERHPLVATALNNLAVLSRDEGDLPRAEALTRQALALYRKLHGERHPSVARSLNNLGLICKDRGDFAQAHQFLRQALQLLEQLHGKRHPRVAASLGNLASVCAAQGDAAGAVRYRMEAVLACRLPQADRDRLEDLRPTDLVCDADTIERLHALGQALRTSGKANEIRRLRQAAQAYRLAGGLLDRLRSGVVTTAESRLVLGDENAAFLPDQVGLADALFRLESKPEDLHTAFMAVEQGRSRLFLEALSRGRAGQVGGVPNALLQQDHDLHARLSELQARIRKENDKTPDKRDTDLVAKLYAELERQQAELDRLAARLRREFPRYAALQYPQPCTLDEARACLADNEAAVLFAVAPKESYAIIVQKKPVPGDKGKGLAVIRLPGGAVLGPLVATLIDEEVLRSDSRCRALGARLFALLLAPLREQLRGKDLLLVPDGVLWALPFELLVEDRGGKNPGKYLVERRRLRYAPSLSLLHLIGQWERTRKVPTEPLWALGDPIFGKDDRRAEGDLNAQTQALLRHYGRQRGGSAWSRLPATGAEVRALGKLYQARAGDVVTGGLATERVLKAASAGGVLARKRYIHLATHGILNSAQGRQPSLVLSLVGNDGKEELGGANDGFLTMNEVNHLRLNADLVVLSACETGKGELTASEGVVGLPLAFLYAGSRGVICSLWQVDDEQTAELMVALYTELKGGKVASAEALARARCKLIAQEQAPFYWAPFILIGN